jgi:hypothetical protein
MASTEPDAEQPPTWVARVPTFELTRVSARSPNPLESRTLSIHSIRENLSPPAARIPVEFRTLSFHVDSLDSNASGSVVNVSGPNEKRPKGAVKGPQGRTPD